MEDQLISFETAKLAKEKGFILGIGWFGFNNKFYVSEGAQIGMLCDNHRGENPVACTQSLLQKWLREVHDIEIYVHKFKPNGAYPKGYYCVSRPLIHYSNEMKDWIFTNFKTYEEALEVGLQEVLKLLSDEFY